VVDDGNLTTREGFEQLTTAGLLAIWEIAKQLPEVAANPELQSLVAVTLPGFGFAMGRQMARLYSYRLPKFATGYAKAFGNDEAKVKENAKRNESNASYHESILFQFRKMMDATDPDVIEPLGYMTGVYAFSGRKPDRLLRGLGRLFCDLEEGELVQLRALLRGIDAVHEVEKADSIVVIIGTQEAYRDVVETASGSSGTIHFEEIVRVIDSDDREGDVGKHPLAERFFMMLKREGLARTPEPNDKWDPENSPTGDRAMEISRPLFESMLALADPQLFGP
jgi:hypothetical protein